MGSVAKFIANELLVEGIENVLSTINDISFDEPGMEIIVILLKIEEGNVVEAKKMLAELSFQPQSELEACILDLIDIRLDILDSNIKGKEVELLELSCKLSHFDDDIITYLNGLIMNYIGICNFMEGKVEEGKLQFKKMADYGQALPAPVLAKRGYSNLTIANIFLCQYREAFDSASRAVLINSEIRDFEWVWATIVKGYASFKLGKIQEGHDLLAKAEEISREKGSNFMTGFAQMLLSITSLHVGEYHTSQNYYRCAIANKNYIAVGHMKHISLFERSQMLFALNQPNLAWNHLKLQEAAFEKSNCINVIYLIKSMKTILALEHDDIQLDTALEEERLKLIKMNNSNQEMLTIFEKVIKAVKSYHSDSVIEKANGFEILYDLYKNDKLDTVMKIYAARKIGEYMCWEASIGRGQNAINRLKEFAKELIESNSAVIKLHGKLLQTKYYQFTNELEMAKNLLTELLSTIYPPIFRPILVMFQTELNRTQYHRRMLARIETTAPDTSLEPNFIIISWKGVMKYYHMIKEGDAFLFLSLIQAIEMFGKSVTGSTASMKHFKLDNLSLLGIKLPENFAIHYGFRGDEKLATKQLEEIGVFITELAFLGELEQSQELVPPATFKKIESIVSLILGS